MSTQEDEIDLREYAATGSRQALGRIAGRYLDFVYGVARREVGDAHLAEDVSQAVFLVLTRKASRIRPPALSSWLFMTTRNISANARTMATRRRFHERQAASLMGEHVMTENTESDQVQLHLNAALAAQSEPDRGIVLMRFMQGMEVNQIGQALGLTESTARKRLERAVERLRKFMAGRGVALSAAGIGMIVSGTSQAAPASLTAAVAGGTAASAATALANATVASVIWTQLKIAAVFLLALGLIGGAWKIVMRQAIISQLPLVASPPTTSASVAADEKPVGTVTYGGIVLDTQGNPVPSVRVWSEFVATDPEKSKAVEIETVTDANGKFAFSPLPALVEITTRSSDWSQRYFRFDHPAHAIAWSERRAERDAEQGGHVDLRVQFRPAVALEVQVRDFDGQPIADAEVMLSLQHLGRTEPGTSYGYMKIPTAQSGLKTDARGIARFERLPDDVRAHVIVSHPEYARYNSQDRYASGAFPARPGYGPFVATLDRGGKILVRLPTSKSAPPVRSAEIFATEEPPARPSGIVTRELFDAQGSYLLTGLKPGKYKVTIRPISGGSPDVMVTSATGVVVTAGNTAEAQLGSVAAQRISGRIVDAVTKLPLADQAIMFSSRQRDSSIRATSDVSGRFMLFAVPGTHMLRYSNYPQGEYRPVDKEVNVVESGPTNLGDIEISSPPAMRGRLADAEGRPVAGSVMIWNEKCKTSPDGSFTLPLSGRRDRRENVFAFNQPLTLGAALWMDEKFLDPKLALPGAELPTIVLRPTSVITGEIVDASAKPVNDAKVAIYFDDSDGGSSGSYRPIWGGFTQEGNRFSFTSVPSGLEMHVDLRTGGAQTQPQIEKLLPGEIRDLGTVMLKPIKPRTPFGTEVPGIAAGERDFTGSVSGRVFGPDGKLLAGARVTAFPENDLSTQVDDITDHEGRFVIRRMARNEKIQVHVSSQGNNEVRVTAQEGDQNIEVRVAGIAAALIGKPAPELAISRWLVGQAKTMAELRGRVVLLDLGVDVSEDEYDYYQMLLNQMRRNEPRGLTIIAVHCEPDNARPNGTTQAQVEEFVKRNQIPFAFTIDMRQRTRSQGWTSGETAARYGLDEPAYILIDKKGIVRASPTIQNMEEWIEKLLAE